MGTIDLDPASSEIANAVVKAGEYFTAEINGLDADWYGNVWLNPPYASDLIGKFCEKIFQEYTQNKVDAALVLVNNATETQWFALLATAAAAICFPSSRVKFWKPEGGTGQPLQGQAVLYFGPDVEAFIHEFRGIGFVVEVLNG
jgi:ParB family chromosome partitioning protein